MKKMLVVICIFAVLVAGCGITKPTDEETTIDMLATEDETPVTENETQDNDEKALPNVIKGDMVFITEGISKVTVYWHDALDGVELPEKYLADMIAWLGTYTLGETAEIPLVPGTNTFWFLIEYVNGESVSTGQDTIEINKTIYDIEHGEEPTWWHDFLRNKG